MSSEIVNSIEIVYENSTRTFRIIDHAEGLSDKDMAEKFSEYGKDTSGSSEGHGVRGLFGQGISDVLFYHQKGVINSIVDKTFYSCKFRVLKDGSWEIDPKKTKTKVDKSLRKSMRIPSGNGTVVSFQLDQNTRKPRKRFIEDLQSFYMLRMIMSNPKREVYYTEINKARETTKKLEYFFPTGKLIGEWEKDIQFEDFNPVTAHVKLSKSEKPLNPGENGLLVFDEKEAVYDCTFFGYLNSYPGTENLFGTVKLTGARKIILHKMNQKKPEEILTDERNGFNEDHDFYKALQAAIKPLIEPYILENKIVKDSNRIPEEQAKNQRKAFDLCDELYRNVMEDITLVAKPKKTFTPPASGIEFDRAQIKVTKDKIYGLGININTKIVPVGSHIQLSSDNDEINVNPSSFRVTKEMIIAEELARRHITISGVKEDEVGQISANFNDITVTVIVNVIEEELIYPDIMQFSPTDISAKLESHGKARLFINTNKIPIGSLISFTVDSSEIGLSKTNHAIVEDDVAYQDIALITLEFLTGAKTSANLKATSLGFEAQAAIKVIDPKVVGPTSPKSKFRDWDFIEGEHIWQCFYDNQPTSPNNGMLLVSKDHPVNKLYFGENPTKESVSKSVLAMTYLAEILLDEILGYMFYEKWNQVKASGGSPLAERDPYNYIRQYISAEKMKIGPQFHKLFVDQKLLKEYEKKAPISLGTVN